MKKKRTTAELCQEIPSSTQRLANAKYNYSIASDALVKAKREHAALMALIYDENKTRSPSGQEAV